MNSAVGIRHGDGHVDDVDVDADRLGGFGFLRGQTAQRQQQQDRKSILHLGQQPSLVILPQRSAV